MCLYNINSCIRACYKKIRECMRIHTHIAVEDCIEDIRGKRGNSTGRVKEVSVKLADDILAR